MFYSQYIFYLQYYMSDCFFLTFLQNKVVVLTCWPSNKHPGSMTCEEFRVAASDFPRRKI